MPQKTMGVHVCVNFTVFKLNCHRGQGKIRKQKLHGTFGWHLEIYGQAVFDFVWCNWNHNEQYWEQHRFVLGSGQVQPTGPFPAWELHLLLPAQDAALLLQRGRCLSLHFTFQVKRSVCNTFPYPGQKNFLAPKKKKKKILHWQLCFSSPFSFFFRSDCLAQARGFGVDKRPCFCSVFGKCAISSRETPCWRVQRFACGIFASRISSSTEIDIRNWFDRCCERNWSTPSTSANPSIRTTTRASRWREIHWRTWPTKRRKTTPTIPTRTESILLPIPTRTLLNPTRSETDPEQIPMKWK